MVVLGDDESDGGGVVFTLTRQINSAHVTPVGFHHHYSPL